MNNAIAESARSDRNPDLTLPAQGAKGVNGDRLGKLIADLAEFGARGDGGVDRQALTPEDFAVRRFLVDLARSYGAEAYRDPIGNLFFRRAGTESGLDPIVTGSHADSQPTGGKLDGAYGVCAGIELLAALQSVEAVHRRPVEVAVWTNEEGCRFPPGSMGASAFNDPDLLPRYLATTDATGRTVGEELAAADPAFADVPLREMKTPIHAFVEAHIEQGPIMVDEGVPVGVVTSIQGTRWYEIVATGQAAHAGSTPRARRQDAFRVAARIANEVYRTFDDGDDLLRMTIGRIDVGPGSVNVIPEEVRMTLDVRHPDEHTLDKIESRLEELVAAQGNAASLERVMKMPPTEFDDLVRNAIRASVTDLGLRSTEISSGAFHDSLYLAQHCPTGMIFVPSIDGLSHNPKEETDLEDLVAGAQLLTATVLRLANS